MSLSSPYVGITGIVTPEDIKTIEACVKLLKTEGTDHRFMAGVLVSQKTLTGQPTTNRRYPKFEVVNDLLEACEQYGAWPVVHYNTRAKGAKFYQELDLLRSRLPHMRGIQLNVVCPDKDAVFAFASDNGKPPVEVILQLNRSSLEATKLHPRDYALDYTRAIGHGISHALLDFSGGNGRTSTISSLVDQITETFFQLQDWEVRLGVAGGLGPECGPFLSDLRAELLGYEGDLDIPLTELSFDAESRVRIPVSDPIEGEKYQDTLDHEKSIAYVKAVCEAMG